MTTEKLFVGECCSLSNIGNGVLNLVFTNPQIHNAFTAKMLLELGDALNIIDTITDINLFRCLLLTAMGKNFCAGVDLKYMQAQGNSSKKENITDATRLGNLFYKLSAIPVPVIAVTKGAAIGGGLGILACCDFVIAAENSFFQLSEAKLGLVPAVISPYVVRKIGFSFAKQIMLQANKISAEEALNMQLITNISANPLQEVSIILQDILSTSANSSRLTKELLLKINPLPNNEIRSLTALTIAEARSTLDAKLGLTSFFQKQPPPWNNRISDDFMQEIIL